MLTKSSKTIAEILDRDAPPTREIEVEYIVTLGLDSVELEPLASGQRQFRCRTRMLAVDCGAVFEAIDRLFVLPSSKAKMNRAVEKALERIAFREATKGVVGRKPRK